MDFGLRLETQQKLMMTQELRQAIAILQLSTQELAAMVEQQFLENPVLEMENAAGDDDQPAGDAPSAGITAANVNELDDYFKDGLKANYQTAVHSDEMAAGSFAAREVSLDEHLQFQLDITFNNPLEHAVGQYIIGCIDHKGYLCSSVEEIAQALAVSTELAGSVLEIIQTFDPEGVGARSLQECLQIQARQQGLYHGLVKAIIEQHLPDLADAKYRWIAERLNSTAHAVQEAADLIRKLNPKPGLAFSTESAGYISADVTVERVNGSYVILVNDSNIPRLFINPSYRQASRQPDSEVKKFIENRLNAAIWLIRSVEQRRNTLYRVTEAILDLQRGFFDHGPPHIRPLIMKTVADRLGIHESTVSRAVANKYINTPHGLFSMRAFFSSCVNTVNGEEMVSGKIKQEIKNLLRSENPASPLSDQGISGLLAKQGIKISRRTVTKYREEMGIASSNKRKRY
ncbi:RNA polymerase factor sigma-54|uniref:RNA polymerase, sigma 54 subunit, RpoN/SigL n=1 Tax=Dendrosporobacter quercicolus TaxID=146817 RepID=A0A1G9U891_9FIRM|nr:RNA polymerase factor sigma-54 [Dendrosporobacter quercicolus]NSL49964.1 RNA polymerase factor sigma-54 [Dendrosporobacter quercicolus DSM 1736]SDM56023.1 RNA polymerase, sigma 54 subunit, RpoN/SigL [Dendrosporobacter quercicolus]